MAGGTVIAAAGQAPIAEISDRGNDYDCQCGHTLRVFGGGRHRVYFEPGNARLDDPVMNGVCPACGRGLPGKNAT